MVILLEYLAEIIPATTRNWIPRCVVNGLGETVILHHIS